MRISAAFAVFVVGLASTATAEPKREETTGRVSLNPAAQPPPAPTRPPSDWVELASPTPAKHGTEFVMVGKDAGYFGKLRLDASKGKVVVRRVKVVFADGKTKVFPINKTISNRGRSAVVDLPSAKPIDRVVITTDTHTSGEYALYGSASGGTVSSR